MEPLAFRTSAVHSVISLALDLSKHFILYRMSGPSFQTLKREIDLTIMVLEGLSHVLDANNNITPDTTRRKPLFKAGRSEDENSDSILREDVGPALNEIRRSFEELQRWVQHKPSFGVQRNCRCNNTQGCAACSDLRNMEYEIKTGRVALMDLLTGETRERLILTIERLRKEENEGCRRTIHWFFKPSRVFILSWPVVGLSAVSAQLMLNYDHSHPLRRNELSSCKGQCGRLPSKDIRQLPDFISSPTPPIFVVATLTYGIATFAFYDLHNNDRHQAWFLMGGILVAAIMGFLDATDFQGIMLSFIPWCITMSLILSACAHRILGRYKMREEVVDEEM